MIKANELRLNNWVMLDGKPTQVLPNDILSVYQHELAGKTHPYKPIEITASIFYTMLGEGKAFLRVSDCLFAYHVGTYGVTIDFEHEDSDRQIAEIKHLHELQNLYYALTGKELEITL